MKRNLKSIVAKALSFGFLLSGLPSAAAFAEGITKPDGFVTPVEEYGTIQVATDEDTGYQQLCDETGKPIQLRGMSTFGLQWGDGNWVLNDAAFDALAYDWECDIIRLAMYVTEGGYAEDPAAGLERVEKGIRLATERGMYVLVDWHMLSPGNPSSDTYLNAGVDLPAFADIKAENPDYTGPQLFFAYLSQKYGDQGNLLFETANEPNGNGGENNADETWTSKLRPYHQGVVEAIRKYDKDSVPNIVICGTDNWSQFVDAPSSDPVEDPAVAEGKASTDQIMYTVHFYAGTHDTKPDEEGKYWLGEKVKKALENGTAVFCTEWGTSEATGDGGPYINYSERWLDFFEEYKISWCSWSLALKNEISAAMQGGAAKEPTDLDGDGIPNWSYATDDTNKDLSITGNYVRAKIRGEEAPQYGASELITDFEDGIAIGYATGDEDTPDKTKYPLEVKDIGGTKALEFGSSTGGIWSGPRVSFQDLGNAYALYSDISFDLYLPDGVELVNDKLEIQPIIQTAELGWWGQIGLVSLTSDDFKLDEETGLMKATVKANFDDVKVGGDKLGHLTFLIGDTNGFYMDNLGLEVWYNGDIADAPVIPDDPGSFIGVPYTFEQGQREGWKPEGASLLDYLTIAIEEVGEDDHAMSFPVAFEEGKNEWEDGARMSSPHGAFSPSDCKTFDAFAMDLYLEKGKATTGEIQLEVCSIPGGNGYWYVSGGATFDPVAGGEAVTTPGGRELLKFTVFVPVNATAENYGVYEFPFDDQVGIRNIVLALHNADSDYAGRVYYDNIRYITGSDPDEYDTEVNFASHNDLLLPIVAGGEAADEQIVDALKTAANDLMTREMWEEYDISIEELVEKAEGLPGNDLTDEEIKAVIEKLGTLVSYSREWVDGVYYATDGSQNYKGIGSWTYSIEDAKWYFKDTLGWYPKNEWEKIDGMWYFFDREGGMEKDTYRNGYYLKANGSWDGQAKVKGWTQDSKGWWYALGNNDYLKSCWKEIDGKWYYFKADGYAAQNEFVKGWWCDQNCVQSDPVQYSWHKTAKGWWYGVSGGWYAKGKAYTIDGVSYTFDKDGYCTNP